MRIEMMKNSRVSVLRPFLIAALLCVALLTAAPARAGSIWIEGENPTEKAVNKHGWYDGVKKDGMSGGDWISHYGDKPGTATYQFDAADAGDYTFWWRGNVSLAKVSYQLNDAKA